MATSSACPTSENGISLMKTVKFSHKFTIENFRAIKSDLIKDKMNFPNVTFSHYGTTWSLEVYKYESPGTVFDPVTPLCIRVWPKLVASQSTDVVRLRYTLSIVKGEENEELRHISSRPRLDYVFNEYKPGEAKEAESISYDDVCNEDLLSNNGTLTILCQMEMLTSVCESTSPDTNFPLQPIERAEIFQKMFEDDTLTDVTLVSGDEESFKAHKVILAAHSDYFTAKFRFDGSAENGAKDQVNMKEFSGEILKEVIHFMYYGKLKSLEKNAVDLLKAADELNMKELLNVCEHHLLAKINADNVCEIAIDTKLIVSAERLRAKCRKFLNDSRASGQDLPGIENILNDVDVLSDLWKHSP